MEVIPKVPEGLEMDLTSGNKLVIRWKDEQAGKRELQTDPEWDPRLNVRVVFRPVIEVEEGNYDADGPEVIVTTIPLESVESIDVDDFRFTREGEDVELLPRSRWVNHPDSGLLRFTAQ